MEQEKAVSLLSRQLIDVQSQANRILEGKDSSEVLEGFSRYSSELKNFIQTRIDNEYIKQLAGEIPEIKYKRNEIQLWQYLILPSWWLSVYKGHIAKKKCLEEIVHAKGKYASIQLLLNGLIN